jgi:hypothetical protein
VAIAAASAAAASHVAVDDVAGLIALSATTRRSHVLILHPARTIRRQKRATDIDDRIGRFDPASTAKSRPHSPIVSRAAAVRRHAVCSAAAHANIIRKISYIIEGDAIVTWLDLIMGHQYGPRGF